MRFLNDEGYVDYTAGTAIRDASRDERKEINKMAKRRSCRRTTNEDKIHEKAVKMRKMTDSQLVEYVENRVEKARSEGRNETKKQNGVKNFIEAFSAPRKISGVGQATIHKLNKFAEEGGYLG